MPAQEIRRGLAFGALGQPEVMAVKRVVVVTVLELLADSTAHFEMSFRRDRQVPAVEKRV